MNTRIGVIGLFALLLAGGTILYLQQDELDRAYVCTSSGELGLFERLSSSNRTAYPQPVGNNTGSKLCGSGGVWVPCNEYAKQFGASCEEPANPQASISIPLDQCISFENETQMVCFDTTNSTLLAEIKAELRP